MTSPNCPTYWDRRLGYQLPYDDSRMENSNPPNNQARKNRQPFVAVRIMGALMTVVFSGSGLMSVLTEYAPERSTRFGMAAPMFGEMAVSFGITIALFGLMPLALLARTPRGAGLFASACAVLALAHLFWSLKH